MPCYGCASNFSLFVKEHTCPNCKFSFCNKCLKGKINIDEVSQKICNNCYRKLTSKTSPSAQHSDPPALLLKRLETLENPAKPPITIFKQKGKLLSLKASLDPKDREILERLEKLKEGHKIASPPSESELKRRLLLLKGLNDENTDEKPRIIQPPAKSEQEEVDDLLKKYMNEMTLERRIEEEGCKSLEDIKKRVQNLHAGESAGMEKPFGSTFEEDEGDFVSKKIIEKAIAEAKLEKRLEKTSLMSDDEDEGEGEGDSVKEEEEEDKISVDFEETELQWCTICDADASLKCIGCDGSFYCNTCFKQGHEFFEMEDHKTVKLK